MAGSRFRPTAFLLALLCSLSWLITGMPALAGQYAALEGVKSLDSVFDFTQGSPQKATILLQAIRGVHSDPSVRELSEAPRTVIVFHGAATSLITTASDGFEADYLMALNGFRDLVRQARRDGIKLEVCMYAVKVLEIDPATLMPEIDQVGNGFISVLGYQAQGYAVVTVP